MAQLTTSCKHLTAEKEEVANRSSQLQELLNARDRQLVKASTHLCQLRAATSCKFGEAGTSTLGPTESAPQLGLTVRSEPIVLSTKQAGALCLLRSFQLAFGLFSLVLQYLKRVRHLKATIEPRVHLCAAVQDDKPRGGPALEGVRVAAVPDSAQSS